jgi:hypothetical protein
VIQTTLSLKQEVTLLRSAVAGLLLRDKEGDYKESFIAETQKAALRTPTKTYKDSKSFLDELNKV